MKLCDIILLEKIEWRIVPGWPRYEVSNTGQIRNVRTMRVLRPQEHFGRDKNEPYLRVQLSNGIKRVNARVSRVVAFAFLGNPPKPDMEVDHLDTNRKNNNVKNLEWVSPYENQRRKIERIYGNQ